MACPAEWDSDPLFDLKWLKRHIMQAADAMTSVLADLGQGGSRGGP